MKVIRFDDGTKYSLEKFNKFCQDAGIEHQLTAPYSLQQNGAVKKKNRTLMEMTRCLLHHKELPEKFWAEVPNTSIFLLNRLPTKSLLNKTPFVAWYGCKPSLLNLKHIVILVSFTFLRLKETNWTRKQNLGSL